MDLRQGNRRVRDYVIEFRTLTTDSGWNDSSLFDAFLHGLAEPMKDQLTPLKLPFEIDALISLATKIDNRFHEREKQKFKHGYTATFQRGQPTTNCHPWQAPAQFIPPFFVLPGGEHLDQIY